MHIKQIRQNNYKRPNIVKQIILILLTMLTERTQYVTERVIVIGIYWESDKKKYGIKSVLYS